MLIIYILAISIIATSTPKICLIDFENPLHLLALISRRKQPRIIRAINSKYSLLPEFAVSLSVVWRSAAGGRCGCCAD